MSYYDHHTVSEEDLWEAQNERDEAREALASLEADYTDLLLENENLQMDNQACLDEIHALLAKIADLEATLRTIATGGDMLLTNEELARHALEEL